MAKKLDYEVVKDVVEQQYGLVLISEEYKNLQTPLELFCSKCGDISYSLEIIRKHKGCPECNHIVTKMKSKSGFNEKPRYGTPLENWRIGHGLTAAELMSLIDYDLTLHQYLEIEAGTAVLSEYLRDKIRLFTGLVI